MKVTLGALALLATTSNAIDAILTSYDTAGDVIRTATTSYSAGDDFTVEIWLGASKRHLAKIELDLESNPAQCRLNLRRPKWSKPAELGDFSPCDWPTRDIDASEAILTLDVRDIVEFKDN